jgi:hypothetical protein
MEGASGRDLRYELGADPPPRIGALPDEQREALATMLRAARRRESAALRQAIENGLGFVPRIARPAVKKVFFG